MNFKLRFIALLLLAVPAGNTFAQQVYRHAAVVTAHPEASRVGNEILKSGGNAVDAAVAIQFALAVVYPNAGNIGGGGFMVYRASKGQTATLDFREMAPAAAARDMYLDAQGNAITNKSIEGALSAGVPGSVAGMVAAHEKYGRLSWAKLVQPAINLAGRGFKLTAMQARELNGTRADFEKYNTQPIALIKPDKWQEGDILRQPELAATLTAIRDRKAKGFYEGEVARAIVQTMKNHGGIITAEDLKNYRAKWRKPVNGKFGDYNVIAMGPPSSGGIALVSMLEGVALYPAFAGWGFQTDKSVSLMVELERRAYADRAAYLGDPDFYRVPEAGLLSSAYIQQRMGGLNLEKAYTSTEVKEGKPMGAEHEQTTHYSIIDAEGNAVSITTTLNNSYGSLLVVEKGGFLLNDEMDDFSVKPGTPNLYGLIGGEANSIAPGKRMLSSMTPTILEKNGRLYMVVGTPGGSTIMTSVFQTIVNVLYFNMNMQQAVSAPRFHHQWLPDVVDVESDAISPEVRRALESKGYTLRKRGRIGRVDAILVLPGGSLQTGADPRGDDVAAGF